MQKIKEIFSRKPEKMGTKVKWIFAPVLIICFYIAFSLIIPMNMGRLSQLLNYILFIAVFLIVMKKFLGISPSIWFNTAGFINFRMFFLGFAVMLATCITTYTVTGLIRPESFVFTFEKEKALADFFSALPVILSGVIAEELSFRGYFLLFPGSNKNKTTKLITAVISSALFTLLHFRNPELKISFTVPVLYYFMFGFSLMMFSYKTQGIELAVGVHLANNFTAAFLITYENAAMQTNALWTLKDNIGSLTLIQASICLIAVAFSIKNFQNKRNL